MNQILPLIGRTDALFTQDIAQHEAELSRIVSESRFLVLGGAGSIGQAVTKEIFKRNPKKLHVVDISENNMVELVRDIRSSFGYIDGDFQTFALDIGSLEYDAFIKADGKFDYILNLSALKHVRSEKDPYTLMRMIDVNVFNTDKTIQQSINAGAKKYFCVSTDKAANPVNMMGASKRIMEMFLMRKSEQMAISTARFANVAFSDGSLLHGFNQRIQKRQPIVAPNDIKRYFVTPQESGELCLMSCVFGENRDIFFPKLSEALHLISFADIAMKYLEQLGFEPRLCETEEEARQLAHTLPEQGKWPCLFTTSDTTGEKDFEEFFTDKEELDMSRFENLGIIKNEPLYEQELLTLFESSISEMKGERAWTKEQIVKLFFTMIPDFGHKETGKYLDSKM
ncbi:TPA: NAD-dependent epimerase/dehydratase family protein [Vibrio parahaemolyticus]|uniref:UDP-N-acetylglucosamine 4,6-dehydratase n=1 Tax=Vibrio parahaemolyticus TaxID=670 RepID=UPI00081367EB|nr:UDP-N-acetylglucosamine 4,6-dehydratase [Vibrio parahaemolyticus]EGQ8312452.1 NAD-dependent epimerase/dehydratase family protein [Vibrio parahaemolyticus]EGQ8850336.1 NAD-dependent epimerase/dehydratase family protein [Vibrio parahaemolyticus]EGQ8854527.1 NAD-dependent epimerase/dehydratase family protein [Vibrio parahaemolyticus]EGQ8873773.1 NAD-dependent epimerase/dehydratase family protein [Vibrio parahaemolyticus]EGQ8993487.1 NAD-dependent epimerase/dehydratase family protein [Vibrio pa